MATRLQLISIPIPLQSSGLAASALTEQRLLDAAFAEEHATLPTAHCIEGPALVALALREVPKAVDAVLATADDFTAPVRRRPVKAVLVDD
jgi:hypothetical protein